MTDERFADRVVVKRRDTGPTNLSEQCERFPVLSKRNGTIPDDAAVHYVFEPFTGFFLFILADLAHCDQVPVTHTFAGGITTRHSAVAPTRTSETCSAGSSPLITACWWRTWTHCARWSPRRCR